MLVLRFGPFDFDPAAGRLFLGPEPVPLSSAQAAILRELLLHRSEIVANAALIKIGWGNTAVNDDSLRQAIRRLRETLGDGYIETFRGRGFRFAAAVEEGDRERASGSVETWLASQRVLAQSVIDIRTLDIRRILCARPQIEQTLREDPDDANACVEFALACGLEYEARAFDARRDSALLQRGIEAARHACELKPRFCAAWTAVAYLGHLSGDKDGAVAAVRKADTLDPETVAETIVLAYVSWGDRRLRFARRLLALFPGLAQGHWLRATVFISRVADDLAAEEIRLGCLAQDAQPQGAPFRGIGLHLLDGQMLARHNRLDEAFAAGMRELASSEGSGHLYERECVSNTHYLLGIVLRRQRKFAEGDAALERALQIAPCHVAATAALHRRVLTSASPVDAAIGRALVLAGENRHADAARVYRDMLLQAPPGLAGWQLPIEPLLNPMAKPEIWAEALTLVRVRAS